jgi:hypothetical protein
MTIIYKINNIYIIIIIVLESLSIRDKTLLPRSSTLSSVPARHQTTKYAAANCTTIFFLIKRKRQKYTIIKLKWQKYTNFLKNNKNIPIYYLNDKNIPNWNLNANFTIKWQKYTNCNKKSHFKIKMTNIYQF